jgi:hypothetical protein
MMIQREWTPALYDRASPVPRAIAFTAGQRSALLLWERRLARQGLSVIFVRDSDDCEEVAEIRFAGEDTVQTSILRTPSGHIVVTGLGAGRIATFDHLPQAIVWSERALGLASPD